MVILTGPTFLDNTNNWESIVFNPDICYDLGVVCNGFEIDIHHKGFVGGIKKNVSGLVPEVEPDDEAQTSQNYKSHCHRKQICVASEWSQAVRPQNVYPGIAERRD